jgi:hypothetical protein
LLPVADGGLDVEDVTCIFGFLGWILRSGFGFFGGVGSSFSEEELELDELSSSSESNKVG